MVDDLKRGYYLLFIDGGKRANEQGQAEGAIGVILQEPDCGAVLATVAEKVGPVGSPHEAEYHVLIRGLKLAARASSTPSQSLVARAFLFHPRVNWLTTFAESLNVAT